MTATAPQHSASPPVRISADAATDDAQWDDYVHAHPAGSFFHLAGWLDVASKAYNYEPIYLTARRGDAIVGMLPLIDVRAPLLGRSLISTAFTVGGGPLANDATCLAALLEAAGDIGAARQARYIECRSDFDGDESWLAKPQTASLFRLTPPLDEAEALKAIPKRRRADIRKAMNAAKDGILTVSHDGEPEIFYKLYAASLHRLGTPVFPKKFLRTLVGAFGERMTISIVEAHGAPVGALLTFYHGAVALPYYVGVKEQGRALHAFDYLYWRVMRRAIERGYSTFNFGRSQNGSGAFHYKKLWGMTPEPLTYRIKLLGASDMPNINARNPKFALVSKLWPRLPLTATNAIGPLLARNFP